MRFALGRAAIVAAGLVLAAISISGDTSAASSAGAERVVSVVAMRFEYIPDTIVLKKGEPVVLELNSLDRVHGFDVPQLGIHGDVPPDGFLRLRIVPDKTGRFLFHCDNFCGSGHEDMQGVIVVE